MASLETFLHRSPPTEYQVYEWEIQVAGHSKMLEKISAGATREQLLALSRRPPAASLQSEIFHGMRLLAIPAQDGSCLIILESLHSTDSSPSLLFPYWHMGACCYIEGQEKEHISYMNRHGRTMDLLPYAMHLSGPIRFIRSIKVMLFLSKVSNSDVILMSMQQMRSVPTRVSLRTNSRLNGLLLSHLCNFHQADVVFIFRSQDGTPPSHLWANSYILSHAAEYFAAMFSFTIQPGNTMPFRPLPAGPPQDPVVPTERGTATLATGETSPENSTKFALCSTVHAIQINDHDYGTYKALIEHLYTAQPIYYGAMSPYEAPEQPGLQQVRPSPKDMYRLAHELHLVDIQKDAIANLITQLSVKNARAELFSEFSQTYTDVQNAIWKWTHENWGALEACKQFDL